MRNGNDNFDKDVFDAQRDFERLVATGEIMPEAAWIAHVTRTMYELGGALYGRELEKIQRSEELSRVQEPFLHLEDVQHLVTVKAGGWVQFAFLHEEATPKIVGWSTMQGEEVALLTQAADRLIEVVYPLLGEQSASKLEAFQKLEAQGAKRMVVINLTRTYLDCLVVTSRAEVCQIARFSKPMSGVPMPAMDLTRLH